MRRPNVLCAGFAKCGTTTLYEILKQHKDIYLPAIKEPPFYFNKKIKSKGFQWYLRKFYDSEIKEKIIMEINNSLTFCDMKDIEEIYKNFGKGTKIIFILRDPIEKAYSFYKYYSMVGTKEILSYFDKNKSYSENFKVFIKNNKLQLIQAKMKNTNEFNNIILDGIYYKRIKEYQKYFGEENVKCFLFEKFVDNPEAVCKQIFDFIHVDGNSCIRYDIKANESNRITYGKWSILLNSFFYNNIYINILVKQIPFISYNFSRNLNRLWDNIVLLLSHKNNDKSKIDRNTYLFLKNLFMCDLKLLQEFFDEDLQKIWFLKYKQK